MPKLKGLPATVPIHEVYNAFRFGFYAGCKFSQQSTSNDDNSYLNIKRLEYLKKRFNFEPPGEMCNPQPYKGFTKNGSNSKI